MLFRSAEAEQEAERALAEAESAKKECTAILGPAATARVESAKPIPFLFLIIIVAFCGEVAFNISRWKLSKWAESRPS